ncbi:hypothetical protein QVD17_11395 [Tagetes erecta]|uniref:Uncharacterized protein n=1 Tax=Tagetes erecta TaxID=13708 RepID=A0AAD8KXV4_TARER|nr:hypothetical protein QVD17_11395 [Tagetes erecta]
MDHQIVEYGNGNKKKHMFQVNQQNQEHKDQDQNDAYVHVLEFRLKFKTQRLQRSQECPCIFKFIGNIGGNYQHPRVVSIGPYHRGKDSLINFDDNKWYFLRKLVLRVSAESSKDLGFLMKEMRELEARTRGCYVSYGDVGTICSYDFVEMMLLDGCFVIELLRFLGKSEDRINKNDDPVFMRPSMVPLMVADLLNLENQLPFFVLESLFEVTRTLEQKEILLPLVMRTIRLVFPVPTKDSFLAHPPKHLLDLVYKSLEPKAYTTRIDNEKQSAHTSNETIQCVTRLRTSGIKFKPRKSVGFLDIEFKNGVLEIPVVNINELNINLITNCLAWEQSSKDVLTYFTDYLYFMNCLIDGPKDVALLRDEGIIMRHSRDDASVVSFFKDLGKNIQVFKFGCSYLSREMREIEAYYSSNWATIMRTLSTHNSP